eukprot:gene7535-8372_t
MAKRNTCGVCNENVAVFYCMQCDCFFCRNCNDSCHDEDCPTKQRSSGFNESINNKDLVREWLESSTGSSTLLESPFQLTLDINKPTHDNLKHRQETQVNLTSRHSPGTMSTGHPASQKKQHATKRPPLPCPRLPASFRNTTTTNDHDNYSYASIDFRPAVITGDGMIAAPICDERETEILGDYNDRDVDVANSEEYHWDDELQSHSASDQFEAAPYAEIEIGNSRKESDEKRLPPPRITQRKTSADKHRNGDDSRDKLRLEVYEDPVDTRPSEEELSKLYASVDFSKKKKKSQKGTVINPGSVIGPYYTNQDIVSSDDQLLCRENAENQPNNNNVVAVVGDGVTEKQAKKDASKVGKSKFFVDIPDNREGTPPPMPKPFSARRKQSAPALLFNRVALPPQLPPRTREALQFDERSYHRSAEELNSSSYAVVGEAVGVNEKKSAARGHRRNLSGDLHVQRRDQSHHHYPLPTTSTTNDTTVGKVEPKRGSEKKSFHKRHRRMKSHETISTVYATATSDNKDTTAPNRPTNSPPSDKENGGQPPYSGKSSADSSLEDTASVSKECKDSVENSYDDMSELMRKAEALISDELPEGWQEVRDGSEVYYWHIWTGTIQYERPVLSATPSSSSRSISPPFSDPSSSQSPSVNEPQEKATQRKSDVYVYYDSDPCHISFFNSPEVRSESPHDKPRQAISFPVHSMGWTDVEEDLMSSNVLADTVNRCISSLAEQRKDLWKISDTWGEGKDIKLILEGESLKLVEPKSKALLLVQPIAKMRVWGVGKEDQRDFAYIARDQKTNKHKCHMFRCHGNVSGRSITNTLHAICNRVLEEKRRAKEKNAKAQKTGSDLLNAPVSSSARGNTAFNEKPYFEQKKCFSAKYIGWTEVTKSSGIDALNKAVTKLLTVREPTNWKTVLVEITISEIKTIDCSTQEVLMEDRVRFISFLGVAKDERMCGYIVAVGMETFVCHVFCCIPHAGTLTRAMEEACKLRYEKFLHKSSVENPSQAQEVETSLPQFQPRSSVKEKGSALKSSVQGLFQKLQKRDSKKKDDSYQTNQDQKMPTLQPGANEYLVKYFGCVQVELGTGIETVQESVEQLSGGAMMIGFLEVTKDGLTLCDSQRTALSRRVIDLDTVSYCGVTSNNGYFGIIQSQGRGKYACHVCQEYKTPVTSIVSAIHEML